MLDFDQSSIGAFLKQKFADFQPQMVSYEYGTVDSCADGIVHVSGLSRAKYGELLEFAGSDDLFREILLAAHWRVSLPLCLAAALLLTIEAAAIPAAMILRCQPSQLTGGEANGAD